MVAMVMRWCYKLANKQLLGQCQMELSTETDYKKLFDVTLLVTIKPTKQSLYFSILISNVP